MAGRSLDGDSTRHLRKQSHTEITDVTETVTTDSPMMPAAGSPGARASAPGDRIGEYELIRLLGRGGMGEVHLARDLRLGRLVAIKLLAEGGAGLDRRLLAEARATARCNHENIVVIHDVGEHDGRPYMVLEYLQGQTLSAWWSERTRLEDERGDRLRVALPPNLALELMIPVVRALAYAHDMGIVHCDLKPSNIMLTTAGAIKVLDFGIARLRREGAAGSLHGSLTSESGIAGGTLPYMAPEQLLGQPVDHRADLWAVGIILFEMVTGSHPILDRHAPPAALLGAAALDHPVPAVAERRPDVGALGSIIDRCLIKDREHRTGSAHVLLQELEAVAGSRHAPTVDRDENPFAGLAAFQEADAERFFGRETDIAALVAKLRSQPLVAVAGPSGTGKSSLVRAGVIPALKRAGEGWEAILIRPGRQPMAALAEVLATLPWHSSARPATGMDGERPGGASLLSRLRAEPGYLGGELRAWARTRLRRILLFVDQFEELYTLGAGAEERAGFLACLDAVADDAASPLRVILTVRSDFLDRMVETRAFMEAVNRGLAFLPPLDRAGLRAALTRPVEALEHRFEHPDMIERILDELDGARGALPLLQFTATKLWAMRDREQRLLSEASLRELGGVAGALIGHADAVLAAMSASDTRLARAIFLRLVTPERTRGLATLAELRDLGPSSGDIGEVLGRLIEARLVAVDSGGNGGRAGEDDGMVEIAHDSLIDTWPLLGRWLDESEEDAVFLARLRSAARDWERSGQAAGLLWTGEAADEARGFAQRYQGELATGEQRYLAAVLAAAERSRRRRNRLFGGALAAAVAVALAMGWLAWQEREASLAATTAARRAEQEAARAARAAMRARDATRMAVMQALSGDPTTQLALVREIEDTDAPPPGAVGEAKRLLYAGVAPAVLTGHEDVVWSASFSPDGERVASASRDGTVRVWRADGLGEPLVLRHDQAAWSASFSPDGARIVSTSSDRRVRIWRADGTGEPLVLGTHDGVVWSASFSPDGARIVSASSDKSVRVWRADGTGEPLVLQGHGDVVWSASYSPDGERIVSASSDRTVRVWRADGTGEPLVLQGHGDVVWSASFSSDGARIVSASRDKTVRVWRADGLGEPLVLRGHDDGVWSASFSPDGTRIISGSSDKTVRMWRADGTGEPLVLRGHDDAVWRVSFSSDGSYILSGSSDKTVRIWRTDGTGEPRILRGHDAGVQCASFSPDGTYIVSGSLDKTVRVWRSGGTREPLVLRGHDDVVTSVEFGPDGNHIASASLDKTVRVWTRDGTGGPLVLRGHEDAVVLASFSPDGTRIASASRDKTVRVWRADGTGEPLVLRGHDDGVWSASFSPDGARIVSASSDKTVRVWRTDGTGEPLVLRGHDDVVWSAFFSPDSTRIVSASYDKTVRVWRADGTGEPLVLRGHDDWVSWAEFSPDGDEIVSASKDKTIRIWSADGAGEPTVLAGHTVWVNAARFSPDGTRIVSASDDQTVRVWSDLAPVTLDDPRLWTATTYCMPIEKRVELLGVTEEVAGRDRQRCLERVAEARGASAAPAP